MIKGTRKEKLIADLRIRDHLIRSGLATKLGGHDEGPNPHEILEAALAACTILTAQLYADRKGMKFEGADVTVTIVEEGAQTRIRREVSYRGDLGADERARLTEIIGKCPIHRLLESQIKIETVVAGPGEGG